MLPSMGRRRRPPAGLLWSLAPRLAVFLIFYAVAGTWVTVAGFGRRLMHLIYSVLQQEVRPRAWGSTALGAA